ncbi:LysR family transcriptional regulator [Bradyrhizobium sp. Pha-3]|uniref:LysR family transcriptional regulator n=1 Tax=Bradyrhizobium sp. Pha-3 TaxID=208375 RepID=UPI0035D3E48E
MDLVARSTNVGLHHLRSAIAAADCGSFRQAAEQLGIRHSSLSRSIGQLEYLVGVSLFHRSSGGVVPTAAGHSILRVSRMVLEQVDMLVAMGWSNGRGEAGRLSIGFCTSISAGRLRASLVEFKHRAPRVELATVERSRTRLMNSLRNGTIDIAIVPGKNLQPDSKCLPIWIERVLILVPKGHRLATYDVIRWADIDDETVLLGTCDPETDEEDLLISKLMTGTKQVKIERHDVSHGILKDLIGMGFGIGLVTESDVGASFAGLIYREIQDGTGPYHIGFHAHWLDGNDNPALKRFLQLLAERYTSPSTDE